MRGGTALFAIGLAFLVIAVANSDTPVFAVVGGLGLNATIVGLFFVVRPLFGRLRKRLPPWLPW